MDVAELMKRAWEAVEKSGVPEQLQEAAFKEAVAALRDQEQDARQGGAGDGGPSTRKKTTAKRTTGRRAAGGRSREPETAATELPDESTFFTQLADDSGVDEQDLRDVLQLTKEGEVRITTPTRRLGSTVVEQAQNGLALVAGARAHGIGEKPVNSKAVRAELDRKNCYDVHNFSSNHLGPMRGFNAGGRNEIVLTSRWVVEFKAAVDQAHGRSADADSS